MWLKQKTDEKRQEAQLLLSPEVADRTVWNSHE